MRTIFTKSIIGGMFAVTGFAFLLAPMSAEATSTTTYNNAVPATFASGVQSTTPTGEFKAISCSSPGNCTAAGQFYNTNGDEEAFTQTETDHAWSTAVPATFASGVQNPYPQATFKAISCSSPGNCTAAGSFYDVNGSFEAFTQTQSNYAWSTAVPATFDPGVQSDNPGDDFKAISCSSPGNCTAAGQFYNVDGNFEAFTQTQSNYAWSTAVPATFESGVQNANPDDGFSSISCTSPGYCIAAGSFHDVNNSYQAFTQTQSNYAWSTAVPATFESGVQSTHPSDTFNAISCASLGNCTAAGWFYDTSGHKLAFTQTQTNNAWSTGVPATFDPGVQNTVTDDRFTTISCASAGNCTAAGSFRDANGHEAFTQTETNYAWGTAVPATFESGVQNTFPSGRFTAISCASAGNCTAAGWFLNTNGDTEAFTQTETNNAWGTAVPATFESGVQNTIPDDQFNAISCSSVGNCAAAGQFANINGDYEAFTQSLTTPIPVTPTTTPVSTPTTTPSTIPSTSGVTTALAATGADLEISGGVGVALLMLGGVAVLSRKRRKKLSPS